jgi:hypothetical protein
VITYLILDTKINAALCGGLGLGSTLIGLVILRYSTKTAVATNVVLVTPVCWDRGKFQKS